MPGYLTSLHGAKTFLVPFPPAPSASLINKTREYRCLPSFPQNLYLSFFSLCRNCLFIYLFFLTCQMRTIPWLSVKPFWRRLFESFSRFVHNTYTATQYETGMYCKLFLFPAFALISFCFQFNINVTSLLPAGIFCVKNGLLLREKEGKNSKERALTILKKLVPFVIQFSTERDLANCQGVDLNNTWRHV